MKREQILAVAKPILFNTEMGLALLDDRKHVTRRVVKGYALEHLEIDTDGAIIGVYDQNEGSVRPIMDYALYRPGDLLYVRETWTKWKTGGYLYRAWPGFEPKEEDEALKKLGLKWRPSTHMPKEAARIFLRVTDVWPQRLQGITEEQAKAEGAFRAMEYSCPEGPAIYEDEAGYYVVGFKSIWNACYASPRPAFEHGVITHYESYPWEDIHEIKTYKGLPLHVCGNPWVWATEFERVAVE